MIPRGIRNKNPGNIERGARWRGLAKDQTDERFCVFESPEWGIRAIARILQTYQKKYGINTIRGAINRWAPPGENDTDAYVESVAVQTEIDPDEPVDFREFKVASAVVQAIIRHENGQQPYSDKEIGIGLHLADVFGVWMVRA